MGEDKTVLALFDRFLEIFQDDISQIKKNLNEAVDASHAAAESAREALKLSKELSKQMEDNGQPGLKTRLTNVETRQTYCRAKRAYEEGHRDSRFSKRWTIIAVTISAASAVIAAIAVIVAIAGSGG